MGKHSFNKIFPADYVNSIFTAAHFLRNNIVFLDGFMIMNHAEQHSHQAILFQNNDFTESHLPVFISFVAACSAG